MSLLTAEKLIADAEMSTGLSDWGSDAFVEPLSVYIASLTRNRKLSERGTELVCRTLLRLLCNRLKMHSVVTNNRALTKKVDIVDVGLPPLVFITGLPRSGTTLLHRLMALDVNARYLRLWEGMFPAPDGQVSADDDEVKRRFAAQWVERMLQVAPAMRAVHRFAADEPEECYLLHEHSFIDSIFELRTQVPEYSEYLAGREADPRLYAEYGQLLRLLSRNNSARYWILKAPRHLMGLAALIQVFPQARVIHVHRPAEEAMASLCSMCEIDRRIYQTEVDRREIGEFWLARMSAAVDSAIAVRARDPVDRYVDVYYTELMANPVAALKNIYKKLNLDWQASHAAAVEDWLRQHPQNEYGRHRYTLSDYSLSVSRVYEHFENYSRRFYREVDHEYAV